MESRVERQTAARTVLAGGDPPVRNALRELVTQRLGMEVVGEADTSATLQRQVQSQGPDLAIVAWNLIVADPAATLATLRRSSSGLRIVVLGLRPDARTAALSAGADAFISMVDAPEAVIRVLHQPPAPGATDDRDEDLRRASGGGGETNEPGGRS